jgi:hypothetical protein
VATSAGGFARDSIYDYMGIPPAVHPLAISALPLRAYNLIWNEWFRDQNLQNSLTVPKGDGPDPVGTYNLARRGKRHDYFTSALPWPQKGASVTLPLGTSAPVRSDGNAINVFNTSSSAIYADPGTSGGTTLRNRVAVGGGADLRWGPSGSAVAGMFTDLSQATAATINDIRRAVQVQRLYERDARGGTRYAELVLAHFGVRSDDSRLQRPEYLGGGQSPVLMSTVAQSTPVTGQGTVGNLGAFATAVVGSHGFSKSFTEHCVVIGLACVRADLNYQQGLHRMWSRRDRFDFYWPALAGLGEQVVVNRELFADGTASDSDVFGYQERYAEYRYKPNAVTGRFRSTHPTPLDVWHLAQHFTSRPSLNGTFIEENPPVSRVVAVNTEPQFIGDFFFRFRAARPMPLFGVPGGLDRF